MRHMRRPYSARTALSERAPTATEYVDASTLPLQRLEFVESAFVGEVNRLRSTKQVDGAESSEPEEATMRERIDKKQLEIEAAELKELVSTLKGQSADI